MASGPDMMQALMARRQQMSASPANSPGAGVPSSSPAPASPPAGEAAVPLTEALRMANKHLAAMIQNEAPMPEEAAPEIETFMQLLMALAQRDQGKDQQAMSPGGGRGFQGSPGQPLPAAPPGPSIMR